MKILWWVIISIILWLLTGLLFVWLDGFAQDIIDCPWWLWSCYQDAKPIHVLKDLVDNNTSDIIETQLDEVNVQQWMFMWEFLKFSNTMDSVRQNLWIYLQRVAFLWLMFATIFIMWSWLRLMFSPLSADQAAQVKKQMIAVVLWVLLISWFYFLLRIVLAIYWEIFVR